MGLLITPRLPPSPHPPHISSRPPFSSPTPASYFSLACFPPSPLPSLSPSLPPIGTPSCRFPPSLSPSPSPCVPIPPSNPRRRLEMH
ncbi:unnamed protein product [Closterium sp. NIES-53]